MEKDWEDGNCSQASDYVTMKKPARAQIAAPLELPHKTTLTTCPWILRKLVEKRSQIRALFSHRSRYIWWPSECLECGWPTNTVLNYKDCSRQTCFLDPKKFRFYIEHAKWYVGLQTRQIMFNETIYRKSSWWETTTAARAYAQRHTIYQRDATASTPNKRKSEDTKGDKVIDKKEERTM